MAGNDKEAAAAAAIIAYNCSLSQHDTAQEKQAIGVKWRQATKY